MRGTVLTIGIFCAHCAGLAADGIWTAGSGSWTNTANWSSDTLPGIGDKALFTGAGGPINNVSATVKALDFNTTSNAAEWALYGSGVTLVAPAEVIVNTVNEAALSLPVAGSDGLIKKGPGYLLLSGSNTFSGTLKVEGGMVRVQDDTALGPVPETLNPAAIYLNGGGLSNARTNMTVHVRRGITVGPLHGSFLARYYSPFVLNCPITGAGNIYITRQAERVWFMNPSNDYSGDLILGWDGPGRWDSPSACSIVGLGATNVLPYGAGKGKVVAYGCFRGGFELNGTVNTLNTLQTFGDLYLSNQRATPGRLRVGEDASSFGVGLFSEANTEFEKIGSGAVSLSVAPASKGLFIHSSGELSIARPSALGRATLRLNGGTWRMAQSQPGLVEWSGSAPAGIADLGAPLTELGVALGPRMGYASLKDFGQNTQYAYKGQWYVPVAATYSFAKAFDDSAVLVIDGQTILSNNVASAFAIVNDVALTAGWHDIALFFANGAGSVGVMRSLSCGLLYDAQNGVFTDASLARAQRFEDPGDGSVLRCFAPESGVSPFMSRLQIAQPTIFDTSAFGLPLVWNNDLVKSPDAAGDPALTFSPTCSELVISNTIQTIVVDANLEGVSSLKLVGKVLLGREYTLPLDLSGVTELALNVPRLEYTNSSIVSRCDVRLLADNVFSAIQVVGTNRTVTLDTSTYTSNALVDAAGQVRDDQTSIAFEGVGGTCVFDGLGMTYYKGQLSGTAQLIKQGRGTLYLTGTNTFAGAIAVQAGTLVVADNASLGVATNSLSVAAAATLSVPANTRVQLDRTIAFAGNSMIDVPADSELLINGALSGATQKTGLGKLTLLGNQANTVQLSVLAGEVDLSKTSGDSVALISTIASNALVRLTGTGEQISGSTTLNGGTLDLNGVSETFWNLHHFSGVITNSSSTSVTLTVPGFLNLGGTLADGPGAPTSLVISNNVAGTNRFYGTLSPQTYSGATRLVKGALHIGNYTYLRMTITKTAGWTAGLAEFQLFRNNQPVAWPSNTVATSANSDGAFPAVNLIDGNSGSFWQTVTNTPTIVIAMPSALSFDAYRLYANPSTDSSTVFKRAPMTWTLEGSMDGSTWSLLDTQVNRLDAIPNNSASAVLGTFPVLRTTAWLSTNSAVVASANTSIVLGQPNQRSPSLSGGGSVDLLENDWTVGSLASFTGMVVNGRVLLSGSRDQVLSPSSASQVRIVNAETTPVTVRFASDKDQIFRALGFDDGNGALSLNKEGGGTLYLLSSDNRYSGQTRIASGTLALVGGRQSYRYLRMTITKVTGSQALPISMSEFQLSLGGSLLPLKTLGTVVTSVYPSFGGYPASNVIDNNWTNDAGRWISNTGIIPNTLVFDFQSPLTFDSYQFYTGTYSSDLDRIPVSWTIEGSDDNVSWRLIDARVDNASSRQLGTLIGPFAVLSTATRGVPQGYWATTNRESDRVEAVRARYIRWTPFETRPSLYSSDYANSGYQLGEFKLMLGTNFLTLANVTASIPGIAFNGMPPSMAFDNIVAMDNRFYSISTYSPLTADFGSNVVFNGYAYYTGQNGAGRDPIAWKLEISTNGTEWILADLRTNQTITAARLALAGTWSLDLATSGTRHYAAIPDTSRVIVETNGTLRVDFADETIGSLEGTGAVRLNDAYLGLNVAADAQFSGRIQGSGTLHAKGTGVQTLSGVLSYTGALQASTRVTLAQAVMAGVTNVMVRSGGSVQGSATVSNALTVAFAGGTYRATLAVQGPLTVSGPVRIGVPDGATYPLKHVLFTYTSLDTASVAALGAATVVASPPPGYEARVIVESTQARLAIVPEGSVLLLR